MSRADKLTPRQREVLALITAGKSNKEISRMLEIAEATTKIHVAGMLRTLGARNRTHAAAMAWDFIRERSDDEESRVIGRS